MKKFKPVLNFSDPVRGSDVKEITIFPKGRKTNDPNYL
jgi:hypothetical protein